MTIAELLAEKGIARADLEVLLAFALGKDRSFLTAHPEFQLSDPEEQKIAEWILRRKNQEPVSYIAGEKEFYGRLFHVDRRVLIPRPSTEGLIDLTLDFLKSGVEETREVDNGIVAISKKFGDLSDAGTIVDIGTGSGCIAITLALERPDLQIIATDISEDVLDVAKKNAKRHVVSDRIQFLHGKDLDPIRDLKELFIIVSNPPYIPQNTILEKDVSGFEPSIALFAGKEGMDVSSSIIAATKNHPWCRGLVLECLSSQVARKSYQV